MSEFNTIDEAIEDIKAGKSVIVVDDEDRENEGDIILAAEKVTPEDINFLAKDARGMICVAITSERARALNLDLMVDENTALHSTPFTVTVVPLPFIRSLIQRLCLQIWRGRVIYFPWSQKPVEYYGVQVIPKRLWI